MKTTILYKNLNVPNWALPFLINGDSSNISRQDRFILSDWMLSIKKEVEKIGGGNWEISTTETTGFTWHPAFGLACDCTECDIIVLTK